MVGVGGFIAQVASGGLAGCQENHSSSKIRPVALSIGTLGKLIVQTALSHMQLCVTNIKVAKRRRWSVLALSVILCANWLLKRIIAVTLLIWLSALRQRSRSV